MMLSPLCSKQNIIQEEIFQYLFSRRNFYPRFICIPQKSFIFSFENYKQATTNVLTVFLFKYQVFVDS
jgi:hypothetical protein